MAYLHWEIQRLLDETAEMAGLQETRPGRVQQKMRVMRHLLWHSFSRWVVPEPCRRPPVHPRLAGRQRGCKERLMRGRFVLCPSSPIKKEIATYHEHDM